MKNYKKARIPQRFWGMKLEDYETSTPTSVRAHNEAVDYVEHLAAHRQAGTGLTFYGGPSAGKTMLMSIIGMEAVDAGYRVLYLSLETYMRWEKNLMGWRDWEPAWGDIEKIRRLTIDIRNHVEFLLLDDVGKEYKTTTGYAEGEFDYLIRSRYDLALPTLMTSNVPVSEWAITYHEAMESFLYEASPPFEIVSKDYRKER